MGTMVLGLETELQGSLNVPDSQMIYERKSSGK